MDSDDEDCKRPITKYGMTESKERLLRQGFHPEVTLKTPSQVEAEAFEYLEKQIRLDRLEYIRRQKYQLGGRKYHGNPDDAPAPRLTKGPWFVTARLAEKPAFKEGIVRPKKASTVRPKDAAVPPAIAPPIASAIGHMHIGPMVMESVFRDGHKTAMKLSLTSSKMFKLVSDCVNRWDFCACNYIVQVPSSVIVVSVPQHTIRDIAEAQKRYKLSSNSPQLADTLQKLESEGNFDSYKLQCIEREKELFEYAKIWRMECWRAHGPYWASADREIDPRTTDRAIEWFDGDNGAINVMGSLKPLDKMWEANQFEGTGDKLHKMPISLATECLSKLMSELHRARSHIEVLHLHEVPLLDRRMLAIILRGLPHVVMLGVYNCPLIHFGDVIPILDLIYEINKERRKKKVPTIKAFDFFPFFNRGMPYAHPNAATYGISWEPIPMDLAQRGFYAVIFKAVMKSRAMRLDLLFSEGHAFMEYLRKVPNAPLGVYGFLDGVYRYLEVRREDRNRANLKLQAIYDMLKPIRVELAADIGLDWPKYYQKEMAKTFLFCSSCGYHTFKEFFPARTQQSLAAHIRVCCACLLQNALDEETDHLKTKKRQVLSKLCPDWKREAFNQDAPLIHGGLGLIRLESTGTVRPNQVYPFFYVQGRGRLAPHWEPLLRDNKRVFDSLVSLPSLRDVALDPATVSRWSKAINSAIKQDVHRLGVIQLGIDYRQGVKRKRIVPFGSVRKDGGKPDHQDEIQALTRRENGYFFDHQSALHLGNWLFNKGW